MIYDLVDRPDMRPQGNGLKIALGRVGPPRHRRNVTLSWMEGIRILVDEIILP